MQLRGQTTTFQTRLEISELAEAWLERHTNCRSSRVLRVDCTQVATTSTKARTRRLHLIHGPSRHWSGQYLSSRIKRGHPSLAHPPSRLGTSHTFSSTQDGYLLVRPAAPESSRHSQAPQTNGLDAPRSFASRPTPTTARLTEHSASRMADGCRAGSCE